MTISFASKIYLVDRKDPTATWLALTIDNGDDVTTIWNVTAYRQSPQYRMITADFNASTETAQVNFCFSNGGRFDARTDIYLDWVHVHGYRSTADVRILSVYLILIVCLVSAIVFNKTDGLPIRTALHGLKPVIVTVLLEIFVAIITWKGRSVADEAVQRLFHVLAAAWLTMALQNINTIRTVRRLMIQATLHLLVALYFGLLYLLSEPENFGVASLQYYMAFLASFLIVAYDAADASRLHQVCALARSIVTSSWLQLLVLVSCVVCAEVLIAKFLHKQATSSEGTSPIWFGAVLVVVGLLEGASIFLIQFLFQCWSEQQEKCTRVVTVVCGSVVAFLMFLSGHTTTSGTSIAIYGLLKSAQLNNEQPSLQITSGEAARSKS
uniref:Uncharacterized protein n=1 Tax=Marseillevirus LCMAC202 TaxID=2506606 RepID=A0A481YZ90_9VIRU|nr:MAG: hypothetical protein LCMAC202_01120 [Marseillevirus LCMAC202]